MVTLYFKDHVYAINTYKCIHYLLAKNILSNIYHLLGMYLTISYS